ncbi:hypothetical protein B5H50_14900, partial [Listeria monocytogenes]|nr:hypothetical protein [Listeria monocytogenes]
MMKLITLFSALLLISTSGINTIVTFQQVVEADTVSLTEASASSDLESTSSSDELADFPAITEQSSEEPPAPS